MRFFLYGIKGSGMAALAIYLKQAGHEVKGADVDSYIYTQDELLKNRIEILNFDNIKLDYIDVLIIGHSFVNKDIEIVKHAKEEMIPIYEYHEFLNMIQGKYKESVAICGSHGKTTVTKLLHHLINYNHNASCLVGDGTAFKEKSNKYFAYEACEYQEHFLMYYPKDIIILNIDYDHNDYFKTLKDYQESYIKFSKNAMNNVFVHEDYANLFSSKIYTYGKNDNSDFYAQNIVLEKEGYSFDFYAFKTYQIHVDTRFFASFMIDHLVGILAYAYIHNFDLYNVAKRVPLFGGVNKRNQEIIINDDIYIIDYAHHPTQMNAMIEMCRNKYKNYEIVAIYKPDRYSRVKEFNKEIAQALLKADYSFVEDFNPNTVKDVNDNTSINDIIEKGNGYIKNFNKIEKNIFSSNKYYVFLLMSSKDVTKIMKKIEKIRLKV